LVLKEPPNKQSSIKKVTSKKKQKSASAAPPKSKKISSTGTKTQSDATKKKSAKVLAKSVESNATDSTQELSLSTRPKDEVVTYDEIDFHLQEISGQPTKVMIGPLSLTRFEKARITGARSLQLSLGAPSLIAIPGGIKDSISLAVAELEVRALPISIRRVLPNGLYQDIPIDWLR
jgi:DNA-directed RNA polymerase I, II, and III subunit RPABC2